MPNALWIWDVQKLTQVATLLQVSNIRGKIKFLIPINMHIHCGVKGEDQKWVTGRFSNKIICDLTGSQSWELMHNNHNQM